jgi:ABC-2 type transport system ATP-binding protein
MIHVDQLTKEYGPTLAVDGVSFDVARGEVVGFLGPNGAGKTTTMRILTCYMPATSGTASIAGHDVFKDSLAVRRNVGYLPEGVPLYTEMRVEEYLRHRAWIKRVPAAGRARRVEYVMERCDLKEMRRRLIGSLSKGFRQRVGLAEALIHDPPVLVLDEPTIGLDPNQIRHVRALIRDLANDHTILLSTHILPEVEMICKRVIIINKGRVVFQDALDHIAAQRAGGARLVVELRAPADAALAALKELPGVLHATCDSVQPVARFDLEVTPGADVREELFQRVVRSGWALRELRTEQPSLEDIFVRLTAKEEA